MNTIEEQPQPQPPSNDNKKKRKKGGGRPFEPYTLFLKKLYNNADKKQINSLNVFRCENGKKSVDELKDYIETFKKKLKHLEYILYERKKYEYKTLEPPTIQ